MSIAEEQYRALFEQANEGIFIADAEGHYLDVNQAGCQMLGFTREEIIHMSITDVISTDEQERVAPEIETGRRDGKIHNHWKFKRKDQSIFIGDVSAVKLSDGRLQAIVSNVTEYMQERRVVGKQEERMRPTLDHLLEGCQIIGFDWRYLYINSAAEIQKPTPQRGAAGQKIYGHVARH